SVVLPAPLGPMRPVISPRATSRSTASRARTPPKRTVISVSWRMGSAMDRLRARLGTGQGPEQRRHAVRLAGGHREGTVGFLGDGDDADGAGARDVAGGGGG